MIRKLRKSLSLLICLAAIMTVGITANALYYPDSFYDDISWTWYYSATYTNSYNCLGYATGSMTWEWPSAWGSVATQSEVDSYMSGLGYSTTSGETKIISYGPGSNDIAHFSKVTGTSWCRAKWGGLERFNHNSYDPYYSSSIYGSKQRYYRQ